MGDKSDPERGQDVLLSGGSWGGQTVCNSWRCIQKLPQTERADTNLCRKQKCQIVKERGGFGSFVDAARPWDRISSRGVSEMSSPCRILSCLVLSQAAWGGRGTSPSMERSSTGHATSSKTSKLETNGAFFFFLLKFSALF